MTGSAACWDATLLDLDGHLLQSSRWGDFKRRHGWDAERVRVDAPGGTGLAQVLFKARGPVSYGYIPRGPTLSAANADLAQTLFASIDDVCRRRRALGLIVEPDTALPLLGRYADWGFVRGPAHIQPERTVKVALGPDRSP